MPALPDLESFEQSIICRKPIVVVMPSGGKRNTFFRPTIRVPRALLLGLSSSFDSDIAAADKEPPLGSRYDIILDYPDDDLSAWKLLLYWAYYHHLPPGKNWNFLSVLLVDAWLLGQAHGITTFQDTVMIELLCLHNCMDLGPLDRAFSATNEGSPLRRVLAEEVVYRYSVAQTIDSSELDDHGCVYGFTGAFAQAMERYRAEDNDMFERLPTRDKQVNERWLEYMVDKEGKRGWKWIDDELEEGGGYFGKCVEL